MPTPVHRRVLHAFRNVPEDAAFLIVAAVLALVTLLPIALHTYPAMADYPNHLARMAIIDNLEQSPLLQRYYAENERLCPNMGMDVLVPLLSGEWLGREDSIRVFMALTILLIAGGALSLGYCLQRTTPWFTLTVFGLLYSRYFIYGFLNYFFALGVALFAAVVWLQMRSWPPWLRWIVSSAIASVLLTLHLVAFGIYALVVGGIELHRVIRERAWARPDTYLVGAQFIVPVLLYFTQFESTHRPISVAQLYVSLSAMVTSKIAGVVGIFAAYDVHAGAVIAAAIIIAMAIALWRKLLVPAPNIWIPALLLGLTFLCLPHGLMGSGFLDRRIPIAASFFLLPFLRLRATPRVLGVFVLSLLTLVSLRVAEVNTLWTQSERVFKDYRAQLLQLRPGAKLYSYIAVEESHMEFPPVRHIAGFAVADRSAFISNLFALPAVCESVHFQPEVAGLNRIETMYPPGEHPDWPFVLANFDNLMIVYAADKPEYPPEFKVVTAQDHFILLENTLARVVPSKDE